VRNHGLIVLAMLGSFQLLACSGNGGSAGEGGTGGGAAGSGGAKTGGGGAKAGSGGGQAGAAGGAVGSAGAAGANGGAGAGGANGGAGAGGAGSGGAAGTGGAAGQAGGGGQAGATATGGSGGHAGAGVAGAAGGAAGAGGGVAGAAGGVAGAGGGAATGGAGGNGGVGGQAGAPPPPPAHALSLLAGGLGGPGNVDGVGANARFHSPAGIALDGAGNLYVADDRNNSIRKVVVATGAVTTLAGQGALVGSFADGTGAGAQFSEPQGVALDGAGNLYVADHSNWAIRKIVIATGAVTTLAGSHDFRDSVDGTGADARFEGPAGIACDGAGSLYVVDTMESDGGFQTKVRKIVIATGAVTTLLTLPGNFYEVPRDIVYDASGNLYVGYAGAVVQLALPSNTVTLLAGSLSQMGQADGTGATAQFYYPSGLFDDGAGNLYVADNGNNWLRKLVIATGTVTTLTDASGAAIRLSGPGGLAGGGGTLFVASDDDTIRELALATDAVTTLAGGAPQPGSANATGAAARFKNPMGIASDGAGNLFVADSYNGIIRKVVVATGAVTTLAGTAGQLGNQDGTGAAATFSQPSGIVSDGAGSVYVTDGGLIRKIVVATGTVTTFATFPPSSVADPGSGGITFDGGNLFFIDSGTAIYELATATGNVRALAGRAGQYGSVNGTGAAARFWAANGIASDGTGNLYVADTGNYAVRRIVVATRVVTTVAGRLTVQGTTDGTGGNARFDYPYGIASDGAGNLYVADSNTVRKIVTSSRTVSTVVGAPASFGVSLGPLPASLSAVYGVAVLPTGALAILDYEENAVLIGSL
jgi:hypothetical protein